MKVIAKPINLICSFDSDGNVKPHRFQYKDQTIKIDKVINQLEEKLAGNRMLVFDCLAIINDKPKLFQLKFEINTLKWILFKI